MFLCVPETGKDTSSSLDTQLHSLDQNRPTHETVLRDHVRKKKTPEVQQVNNTIIGVFVFHALDLLFILLVLSSGQFSYGRLP